MFNVRTQTVEDRKPSWERQRIRVNNDRRLTFNLYKEARKARHG